MSGHTLGSMSLSGGRFKMNGGEWQSLNIGTQNIAVVGIDPRTLEGFADGKRLSAAWNACATLSTEALEAGVVDKLVEAASVAVEELDCIAEFAMRQTEWTGDDDAALLAVKNLRAALALARGEQA